MPCVTGTPTQEELERMIAGDAEKAARELKHNLDEVTAILCGLLGTFQMSEFLKLPPNVQDWYLKHKEFDRSQGR